jgi:coenzyme F420-reducing hydrogenase beta subunit
LFPFLLVCDRNQVYCACCSAQTAHKLVSFNLISKVDNRHYELTILIYTYCVTKERYNNLLSSQTIKDKSKSQGHFWNKTRLKSLSKLSCGNSWKLNFNRPHHDKVWAGKTDTVWATPLPPPSSILQNPGKTADFLVLL